MFLAKAKDITTVPYWLGRAQAVVTLDRGELFCHSNALPEVLSKLKLTSDAVIVEKKDEKGENFAMVDPGCGVKTITARLS